MRQVYDLDALARVIRSVLMVVEEDAAEHFLREIGEFYQARGKSASLSSSSEDLDWVGKTPSQASPRPDRGLHVPPSSLPANGVLRDIVG
jgi:hypothetical protein